MLGQKQSHQVKSSKILVYTLEARFTTRFWWNFIKMFVLAISRPISNMGNVWLTSRSQGQILEKNLYFRGNISHRIFMKLGQIVCFDNI